MATAAGTRTLHFLANVRVPLKEMYPVKTITSFSTDNMCYGSIRGIMECFSFYDVCFCALC